MEGLTVDSLWSGGLGRTIIGREKLKCLEKYLAQFHFIHTGIEPRPLQ
jgi:hypothetical protein